MRQGGKEKGTVLWEEQKLNSQGEKKRDGDQLGGPKKGPRVGAQNTKIRTGGGGGGGKSCRQRLSF